MIVMMMSWFPPPPPMIIKLIVWHPPHVIIINKSLKQLMTVHNYLILILTWKLFLKLNKSWLKYVKTAENNMLVLFACLKLEIIDVSFNILPFCPSHHHHIWMAPNILMIHMRNHQLLKKPWMIVVSDVLNVLHSVVLYKEYSRSCLISPFKIHTFVCCLKKAKW